MKKKYVKDEEQTLIQELQALNIDVTAIGAYIYSLDIPNDVDIKTVEQIVGFKLKEKK